MLIKCIRSKIFLPKGPCLLTLNCKIRMLIMIDSLEFYYCSPWSWSKNALSLVDSWDESLRNEKTNIIWSGFMVYRFFFWGGGTSEKLSIGVCLTPSGKVYHAYKQLTINATDRSCNRGRPGRRSGKFGKICY